MATHWINPDLQTTAAGQPIINNNNNNNNLLQDVECLCVGTGRFLRTVLMPLLQHHKTVIVQPRGRSFLEFMQKQQQPQQQLQAGEGDASNKYPVDTVLRCGQVETEYVNCAAVFSWGQAQDKQAFYEHLPSFASGSAGGSAGISILGLGVTEAGLSSHDTPVMLDLYQLFETIRDLQMTTTATPPKRKGKICVVDMDNVPNNGSTIQRHMLTLAAAERQDTNGNGNEMSMQQFFTERVAFLNTMVDRITSQRSDDAMIPRAEPVPAKALVILDPDGDLPSWFTSMATTSTTNGSSGEEEEEKKKKYGLVIRSTAAQLDNDVNLKLRIANGTHTAIAHVMALLKLTMSDSLQLSSPTHASSASANKSILLMDYLESLARDQILVAAAASIASNTAGVNGVEMAQEQAMAVWKDWRERLTHAHFGLSTFFITQNGAAKGGIRLTPTVVDLIQGSCGNKPRDDSTTTTTASGIHGSMAFCFAVLLRWLTPMSSQADAPTAASAALSRVFTGWLPKEESSIQSGSKTDSVSSATVTYADGLQYNLDEGWYQFRCDCQVVEPNSMKSYNLSEWLAKLVGSSSQQPAVFVDAIQAYLLAPSGGNQGSIADTKAFAIFSQAVATLYARMVAGDCLLEVLQEMKDCKDPYKSGFTSDCSVLVDNPSTREGSPLHYRPTPIPSHSALMKLPVTVSDLNSVIASEVSSVLAIDLHTHLLPPSHGALCLWGIDELLTYHYLVAEYFMIAPASMSPDDFYSMNKQKQADCIWQSLFLDRSPISEACRGVITTLVALGLSQEVRMRDLNAIREFYARFRENGLNGAEEFSEIIFSLAGVRYNVMTNIPFDSNEAQHWRPKRKSYPKRYRSALRVDPLLSGDRRTIEVALKGSGYETTLEGARQYLRDWCDTMQPEYMMASTPHDFALKEGTVATTIARGGVNQDAMREPGAFADSIGGHPTCTGSEDDSPSVIDEQSDFLSQVLMKVCAERDLPIALKIGAHRGVNPQLMAAGDGVVAFADASMLGRLCARFPKVRFLATFLSRNNQHEACVLATKFRNLHIYGCWWFCNNPSIIKEITQMRVEMLGTSFTAQHSDARVLDQLAYKWPHSRSVIACVLTEEYAKLINSGWMPTRAEIRRDVERLFGGTYEEFMAKSLR